MVGVEPVANPVGMYGRLGDFRGKDTTVAIGRWLVLRQQSHFRYTRMVFLRMSSVPFIEATGVQGFLEDCAASGTEIIAILGDEHVRSRKPIVYTSADSVSRWHAMSPSIHRKNSIRCVRPARKILTGDMKLQGSLLVLSWVDMGKAYPDVKPPGFFNPARSQKPACGNERCWSGRGWRRQNPKIFSIMWGSPKLCIRRIIWMAWM